MSPEFSGGTLNSPIDLAFGPDDNLYIASLGTDNVQRFNGTTGVYMDIFASTDNPTGLVFYTPSASPVPEPATLILLSSALFGLLPLKKKLSNLA